MDLEELVLVVVIMIAWGVVEVWAREIGAITWGRITGAEAKSMMNDEGGAAYVLKVLAAMQEQIDDMGEDMRSLSREVAWIGEYLEHGSKDEDEDEDDAGEDED